MTKLVDGFFVIVVIIFNVIVPYLMLLYPLFLSPELKIKEAESDDSKLREYHCSTCDKVLHLSSIGILKHKRMHARSKQ